MNKQERVALAIKEVVSKMMDRVMEENNHSNSPLYDDTITGNIGLGRLKRIQRVLNQSYHKNYEFDWEKEIKYILAARGQLFPVTANRDIFKQIKRIESNLNFDLKHSKSGIYKIRAIKENVLKLIVMNY